MPKDTVSRQDKEAFLSETGYGWGDATSPDMIRFLDDGTVVFAHRLIFHYTVLQMIPGDFGPFDRWCYRDLAGAMQALHDWPQEPPEGYEPVGWHRHPATGRRRLNGDPELEYTDHPSELEARRRLRESLSEDPAAKT